jgi:cytoskeletal protein RodZ
MDKAVKRIKGSQTKVAIAVSAFVVMLVLGLVYVLLVWQPTPNKTITQTLQQKIETPKPQQVDAADQELEETDKNLDVDLDTTDLDQDIDALL